VDGGVTGLRPDYPPLHSAQSKSPRLSSTSLDVLPPVLPTQQRCKLVRGLHFDPRRILNSSIPLVPGDRTNREGVRRQGWLHVPYIGAHPFLTVFYATVNMETRHAVTQPRIARILHLATHHGDTLQPRVAPQQVLGVWDGVDWGFRPHCVNDIYTVTAACSACFSNINQLHQLLLLSWLLSSCFFHSIISIIHLSPKRPLLSFRGIYLSKWA
jgi:hypothetical protein